MSTVGLELRWLCVFGDVPAPAFALSARYWSAVSGAGVGAPAGDEGEFVPLEPAAGDAYLWLQRVGRELPGWHPDFLVTDVAAAAEHAQACGARLLVAGDPLTVLESPAGQPLCLYAHDGPSRTRPPAPTWPGVGRSLADQLCLDIPSEAYEPECAFWSELTGWPVVYTGAPEFRRLNPPGELPVQFLLQRLGADDADGMRAHLDMSADAPAAEVARHVALGGAVVAEFAHWTTLRDPAGLLYCVTHRRPYEPSR
jgi:hypothetical protein